MNSASNGYITGAEGRSGWTNYPEECIVPNGGGGGAMLEMGRGGSGGASSGTFSDPHYSDSHYQLNIYY